MTIPHSSARRLGAGVTLLVALDLGGGLLAVRSGVNTWADAWGSRALLAAPWPMISGQVLLTWLATRTTRRIGALPAGLLTLACLVSAASGFFDGGLGHHRLSGGLVAYQVVLLTATAGVGVLAAARARSVWAWRDTGVAAPDSGILAG